MAKVYGGKARRIESTNRMPTATADDDTRIVECGLVRAAGFEADAPVLVADDAGVASADGGDGGGGVNSHALCTEAFGPLLAVVEVEMGEDESTDSYMARWAGRAATTSPHPTPPYYAPSYPIPSHRIASRAIPLRHPTAHRSSPTPPTSGAAHGRTRTMFVAPSPARSSRRLRRARPLSTTPPPRSTLARWPSTHGAWYVQWKRVASPPPPPPPPPPLPPPPPPPRRASHNRSSSPRDSPSPSPLQ